MLEKISNFLKEREKDKTKKMERTKQSVTHKRPYGGKNPRKSNRNTNKKNTKNVEVKKDDSGLELLHFERFIVTKNQQIYSFESYHSSVW